MNAINLFELVKLLSKLWTGSFFYAIPEPISLCTVAMEFDTGTKLG